MGLLGLAGVKMKKEKRESESWRVSPPEITQGEERRVLAGDLQLTLGN